MLDGTLSDVTSVVVGSKYQAEPARPSPLVCVTVMNGGVLATFELIPQWKCGSSLVPSL